MAVVGTISCGSCSSALMYDCSNTSTFETTYCNCANQGGRVSCSGCASGHTGCTTCLSSSSILLAGEQLYKSRMSSIVDYRYADVGIEAVDVYNYFKGINYKSQPANYSLTEGYYTYNYKLFTYSSSARMYSGYTRGSQDYWMFDWNNYTPGFSSQTSAKFTTYVNVGDTEVGNYIFYGTTTIYIEIFAGPYRYEHTHTLSNAAGNYQSYTYTFTTQERQRMTQYGFTVYVNWESARLGSTKTASWTMSAAV